ncbi:hypothetical protein ACFZB2_04850 [Streptomyces bobili]|uniref:hypothetical protein n=2 Tax=Streptomyces bobili TaxID=67280 RepID=UPI0036E3D30F
MPFAEQGDDMRPFSTVIVPVVAVMDLTEVRERPAVVLVQRLVEVHIAHDLCNRLLPVELGDGPGITPQQSVGKHTITFAAGPVPGRFTGGYVRSWWDRACMNTPFDLREAETAEEAVIARYRLSDDHYGSRAEREAIFDAERSMAAAVEEAGVGEVDGNEFGGGEAVLYAYGADAEALFKVMESALRRLPFRPAHVVLRQGPRETESRVDL